MASQVQIPFQGVILQEHSAPISCPTPNFAKGSLGRSPVFPDVPIPAWQGGTPAEVSLSAGCAPAQKVAMGLSGDPVPPSTGSGAAVIRNSQRFSRRAVALRASRSQLSKMGTPMAMMESW